MTNQWKLQAPQGMRGHDFVINATQHMNEESIYYLAMTRESSTTITSAAAIQQSYNRSLHQKEIAR